MTYELTSSDLLNYVQYWCFRVGLNWMNGWVSRGDDGGGGGEINCRARASMFGSARGRIWLTCLNINGLISYSAFAYGESGNRK